MKTYEVTVTNTDDTSDVSTFEHISDDSETSAYEIMSTIERAIDYKDELKFKDGDRIITIEPASDLHGYYYTIYESEKDYENGDDSGGGLCTGTLSDAIEMSLN